MNDRLSRIRHLLRSAATQTAQTNGSTEAPLPVRLLVTIAVMVVVAVAVLFGSAATADACTPTNYIATSSAPPPTANWTDTTFWSPSGSYPGSGSCDTATDNNATPTTIVVNTVIPNGLIGLNFSCPGCVIDIQSGGQLTINGPGTIAGGTVVQLNGGALVINTPSASGGVTFQSGSELHLISGALSGSGTLNIASDGVMSWGSTDSLDISGLTINNSGTTTFAPTAAATLLMSGGATINNSGAFNLVTGPLTISDNGGGANVINNSGTLQSSGTALIGTPLNNLAGGSVEVTGGDLSLYADGTGNAPFTIDSGAILDFPSGSYTMTPNGIISGAGTLSVSGATLSIGGVTEPSGFTLSAGTLTGAGFLSIGSQFNWSGGTITGSGGAELAGAATGSMTGADGTMLLDGRSFNVYGSLDLSATTNPFQLANGSAFSIYGTFTISNDSSITCNCTVAPLLSVSPNGLMLKTGGAGTATIFVPTNNSATVYSFSGNLEFAGNGDHIGSFNAIAGATITFAAPTTIFESQSFVGGDGTIAFIGGSSDVKGTYQSTGLTSISGSAFVTIDNGASMSDFTFNGGTLDLESQLTMTGTGTWSAGLMNGSSGFDVASSATFTIDAANGDTTIDMITFTNEGTVNYTATAYELKFENMSFENDGLFDIQSDGYIEDGPSFARPRPSGASGSATPAKRKHPARVRSDWAATSTFDNYGTFQKSAGSGTSSFDPGFNNSNSVKALSGTIDFTDTFTQYGGSTTLGAGSITVANPLLLNGGVLNGSGTLTGDLQNDAEVAPGDTGTTIGVVNVTGNYTQQNGGLLTIKIGGPMAGDFDQLTVGASATLDGTFTANLINSYEPPDGTTWPVLTFASHSGDFATKNLPTYPVHGSIVSSYSPTSFDLTAVVAPSSSDLAITMTGPASVNAGDPLSYLITITNNGPDSSSGTITVSDMLPVGATAASASGSGWTCGAPAGGIITCTNNTALGNGASASVLTVSMTAGAIGGATQNSASVSSASDPNNANNSAFVNTTVVAQANLAISKSGPGGVTSGQNIVYTVTVTNNGPSQATGITVTDPTPVSLTFVSNSGACATAYPCSLGTLNSGQSATITSTYSTPGAFSGNVTNTATVTSSTTDPNSSDNSASTVTNVGGQADLAITKTGPASVNAGQNVVYTIIVTNNGPSAAVSTVVSDSTPSGLTFVSNGGNCTGAYPCSLGTLNSGQSATITSTYNVPAGYSSTSITNTATASSTTNDPTPGNNSASATTTVVTSAPSTDLLISKGGPAQANPNTTVDYSVVVFNNGAGAAANVVVSDPTPSGLTFVSNSGDCTTAYPCSLGTLAPMQAIHITSRYIVHGAAGSTITNIASVSTSSSDSNLSNNSDSTTLHVVATTLCPTQTPQLIAPAAGTTTISPVTLSWTAVPNATSYTVSITGPGGTSTAIATGTSFMTILASGSYSWFVQATGASGCQPISSASSSFSVCNTPDAPVASVIGESTTGQTYTVSWSAIDEATGYELQESTEPTFANPTTTSLTATSKSFTRVAQTETPYFYRVRALGGCNQGAGGYGPTISVVVLPVPNPDGSGSGINVPVGSTQPVVFKVFVPGLPGGTTSFVATVDKPWLAVTPTAGIVPPEGMNVTVSADPTTLSNGTWMGTVIVVYGTSNVSGRTASESTTTSTSIPVSISLVTPVTPAALTTPSASAMVIPSVGHLAGASANWRSDVRVANVSPQTQRYSLSFNPAAGNPSAAVKKTVITIDPGVTTALDDIVRNWYGIGSLGDSSNGVLTIQPINSNGTPVGASFDPKSVVVSSRTYDATATGGGTLGQFIPATPFAGFITAVAGSPASFLSLQQIAQSDAFRTNLGLVEAAGKPATALVSVFDQNGKNLLALPVSMKAGEQKQLNSFLAENGIELTNGRIEVEPISGDGAITAYASVVDNQTNDPFLVSGVTINSIGSSRYVVAGVGDINSDVATWHSDLRLFNGGAAPETATLTFYPNGDSSASVSKTVALDPGTVKPIDNLLQSLFGLTNVNGTLHVTTTSPSPLVVTARTFDQTADGTFGQFIPAITPADAVAANGRALQILQAEQSVRYRTNLGIAEVSGKPVTVEVTVALPDSKVSPKVQIPLDAYESMQVPILSSLGIGATYNARISVRVVDGDGSITAYGSVVDMTTQDPTFIPAQ